MKTRLLIVSCCTLSVACGLAMALRPAAAAQEPAVAVAEESAPPPAAVAAGAAPDSAEAGGEQPDPAADFEIVAVDEEDRSADDRPAASEEEAEAAGQVLNGSDEADAAETASDAGEAAETEAPDALADADLSQLEIADETAPEELTFDFTDMAGDVDVAVRDEEQDTLTVDFPDEEIRTILRTVADIFYLNLVIPETLVGRASIKLHDVTWRQVFDVVLSPVGFTYVEDGNIIKVVSLETLTLEPPVTRVVILDYAQAGDIVATLEPLVSSQNGGRVQIDKRSNALVITERPTQLRRIENIIEALDKPNVQVMIESKFVETRNRAIENIGVNWASLDGYGVSAGPIEHSYSRESVRTSETARDRSRGNSQSQSSQSVNNGAPSTTTTTGSTADQAFSNLDTLIDGTQTTKLTTAVFSADEFGVILSALRTNNDVKLVSNPTVVTMNNQPAHIHIGEEFPIVLPRFNSQTGTYEAGEYDTVDIGIKLNVTPQVNNAGFINLDVMPDVSTLTDRITYFGAEYPVRSTRNAKSLVTVKDGYTLAIGGLVQEDTATGETRVPVLGSIPVLGRLFRSNSNDSDQRNLIIFLTARTISPAGMTIEDQVDPRMIHNMGLRRDEIPGYRPNIPMWPDEPKADHPEAAVEPMPEAVLEPTAEDFAETETGVSAIEALETEADAPETETEAPEPVEAAEGEIQLIQTAATEAETAETEAVKPGGIAEETPAADVAGGEIGTEAAAEEPQPEAAPRRRSSGWLMP